MEENKQLIEIDTNYNWEEAALATAYQLIEYFDLDPRNFDLVGNLVSAVENSLSHIYSDNQMIAMEDEKYYGTFRASPKDLKKLQAYREKRIRDPTPDKPPEIRKQRKIDALKNKVNKAEQKRAKEKSKWRDMYEEWLLREDSLVNISSNIWSAIYKIMPNARRRGKRAASKSVTKTGVKRLITSEANKIGDLTVHKQGSFAVRTGSDGGTSIDPDGTGALVYGFRAIHGVSFEEYNDFVAADNSYQDRMSYLYPFPTVGGADQLPSTNVYRLTAEKTVVHFLIHNPMNENVRATFWWLRAAQDSGVTPHATWLTEYQQFDAASSVDFAARDWYQAFTDNSPTFYKQFGHYFEIVEKYETVFAPGQTKTMDCPMRKFSSVPLEMSASDSYIKGLTHWLLVKIEGVPTAQNTAGVYDSSKISYSPSSLEFVWNFKRTVHMNVNDFKFNSFAASGLGAVTEGRSTVVAAASKIDES